MEHSTSAKAARFRDNEKSHGSENYAVQPANYSGFAARGSGFDAEAVLAGGIETVRWKVPVFRPEPKNY